MSNGDQKITYFFAETEILTQPTKDITMPNAEVGIISHRKYWIKSRRQLQSWATTNCHSRVTMV